MYNLAAEYASLLIVCIAMVSFTLDDTIVSVRYKALKWMYYATFAAIVVSILSVITIDNHTAYPIFITTFFKYLFNLVSPLPAAVVLIYSITLTYSKTSNFNILKKCVWAWLPYVLYCLVILSNLFHSLFFTITAQEGYLQGPFSRVTYIIAIFYFVMVIAFTIKNFNSPYRNTLLIICLNFFISAIVFCLQLLFPYVQLSGLACISGLLIIHFYVQNLSMSTDTLTEVGSRFALTKRLDKLCVKGTPYSLVVLSLRNFKGVNDSYGLDFGDRVLESLALRLRTMLPHKSLYRYSGDEFACILFERDLHLFSDINKTSEEIQKPFTIDSTQISLDMVYSRVNFPDFGKNTEEIISSLDYSISILKNNYGETNISYDVSIRDKMKRRNYIIDSLKTAINEHQFEAHYQPIYSLKHSGFRYGEALIRLKDKNGTPISPAEFIPIAEETGLITKITYIMLEKVCSDFRQFIDTYKDELKLDSISVNFPYVQFLKEESVKEVTNILNKYNIAPSQIIIELTERVLSSDLHTTKSIINEFIKHGFVFELDDFGVEYSNFGTLFKMPIKVIKFDRSLVYATAGDKSRREFFKLFLQSIKTAGIEVVMEGVEEKELLEFLLDCNSDYIQGYVLSKPLPPKEFIEFIMKD